MLPRMTGWQYSDSERRAVSRRRPAVWLAAAVLLAGACAPQRPAATPRNIILVLVDTLRADHLSAYGYARPTSPAFDRFAASSLFFANAYSQAACTFPSVNAILTGRYPVRFLGQPEGRMGIPDDVPALASIVRSQGYATAAVSASPIVRSSPTHFNPHGGFAAGFDSFDEACLWREAACVTERGLAWLATRPAGEPFFLYLHYMDPHGPYQPPADHKRRFAGPYAGQDFIRHGDPNPIARMLYAEGPQVDLTRADVQHLVDLYDDEIASFDDSFARLLWRVSALGVADDTVVAFVADHGEEFLEHGEIKHCRALWQAEVGAPLAIRIPGRAAQRIEAAVETVALAPTLLAAVGIAPPPGFEAKSLLEPPPDDAVAFSEQGVRRSATDRRYKLIYDMDKGGVALYDLQADAAERHDLAAERPKVVAGLEARLFDWLKRVEGATASPRSLDAAREAEKQLKALGYLQ